MRELDFAPLYRSAIGFDHLMAVLQNAARADTGDAVPPYDIRKIDENSYAITMAVAGFSQEELSLTVEGGELIIAGKKNTQDSGQYLHHGISTNSFERRFGLEPHIEVRGAQLLNGLLTVDLVRELPERLKPRRIEIGTSASAPRALDRTAA